MCVKVADSYSRAVPVTSGVPQGSVLGHSLFLIYINHVVSHLNCELEIFADDIKLHLSFECLDAHTRLSLQSDVDLLVSTSSSRELHINPSKCAVIRFASRSSALPVTGLSPYRVDGLNIAFKTSLRFGGDH